MIKDSYPDERSRSAVLAERARTILPGGSTRHTVHFTPYPVYAASGEAYWLADVDGRRYVDCVNNMSALLHGHCHPSIVAAIVGQAQRLTSVALPTESEISLAEVLCERVASVERVCFTNSGSEAVMLACRTARAYTGRPKIAKVEGAYHGAYDAVNVSVKSRPPDWGEPTAPRTVPDSGGIAPGVLADTIVLPANAIDDAVRVIEAHASQLAAVVVDPVVPRMGFLALDSDYLVAVRETTAKHGIILLFDEVFSFRLGYGGRQGQLGIQPDLTTFGKIIGGGLPAGAVGGTAEIMAVLDPGGTTPTVGNNGTFNGNPLTMAAGLAAMELWTEPEIVRLNTLGERLRNGLRKALGRRGVAACIQGDGSLTALVLADGPVRNYRELQGASARAGGPATLALLHRRLLNAGVLTTPTGWFILSTPMNEGVVDRIVEAVDGALHDLARPAPAQA